MSVDPIIKNIQHYNNKIDKTFGLDKNFNALSIIVNFILPLAGIIIVVWYISRENTARNERIYQNEKMHRNERNYQRQRHNHQE